MKELIRGMLWYNLRLIPKKNLIISILLVLGIQTFFSLKMVDFEFMANIGELCVSILGIILIPGAAFIDEDSDIKEVICSKAISPVFPSIVRLFYLVILLFLGIVVFVEIAVVQGSQFDEFSIIAGVFISALLLGASGYMIGSLFKNIALSYLIPFGYYGFELTTKGKYTNDLYLFSLQKGYLAEGKWVLLGIAVLFFMISLAYIVNKKTCI